MKKNTVFHVCVVALFFCVAALGFGANQIIDIPGVILFEIPDSLTLYSDGYENDEAMIKEELAASQGELFSISLDPKTETHDILWASFEIKIELVRTPQFLSNLADRDYYFSLTDEEEIAQLGSGEFVNQDLGYRAEYQAAEYTIIGGKFALKEHTDYHWDDGNTTTVEEYFVRDGYWELFITAIYYDQDYRAHWEPVVADFVKSINISKNGFTLPPASNLVDYTESVISPASVSEVSQQPEVITIPGVLSFERPAELEMYLYGEDTLEDYIQSELSDSLSYFSLYLEQVNPSPRTGAWYDIEAEISVELMDEYIPNAAYSLLTPEDLAIMDETEAEMVSWYDTVETWFPLEVVELGEKYALKKEYIADWGGRYYDHITSYVIRDGYWQLIIEFIYTASEKPYWEPVTNKLLDSLSFPDRISLPKAEVKVSIPPEDLIPVTPQESLPENFSWYLMPETIKYIGLPYEPEWSVESTDEETGMTVMSSLPRFSDFTVNGFKVELVTITIDLSTYPEHYLPAGERQAVMDSILGEVDALVVGSYKEHEVITDSDAAWLLVTGITYDTNAQAEVNIATFEQFLPNGFVTCTIKWNEKGAQTAQGIIDSLTR